ncbi:PaaX family transcriptional regulator [Amycolatopsis jejuensis]|uniref:PaaX family transcriptional regulator n=1 Tax=Amycolatopsis jejuensis TaxID=330084 RepID=UPI00069085A4|nr:PaaX family transcriptional regulator C-terminal domain-containing protein [Amycolatopsis jejuensis]
MQPQDLCFTIFGTYLRERGRLAWAGGLVLLLGELGVTTDSARQALNRLAARGLIERTKRGREVYYGQTPQTHELMDVGDRRIFRFGEAVGEVGTWTVLWHALPEGMHTERSALGRWLRLMGFGLVQHATWITPHDRAEEVVQVLENLGVAEHASVLVGRPLPALNVDVLLREAWDLDDVQQRYEAFVEEFAPYRAKAAQRSLDDRSAFAVCTRVRHEFRGFPYLDPELPDRFLPRPAARSAAIATFHEVYEGLLAPATRYFHAVAGESRTSAG